MKLNSLFIYLSISVLASFNYSCGGESEGEEGSSDSTEVAAGPQYDISVNFVHDDTVPVECQVMDAYLDCHYWTDVNGENYFLRSLGFPIESDERSETGDATRSQYIYSYHYRETSEGISLVNEFKDSVMSCGFDVMMDHVKDCYFVTDIDEDDMGEVTIMYRKTCTSDVSPSDQVLMIIEGNDLYTVTGTSFVLGEGGDYELGPEFANAPEGFEEHAKGIWEDFKDEMGAF